MCGLYGALSFTDRPVERAVAIAMSEKIARRGPDDEGYWCEEAIMLGHRRLSIIDLSVLGHQPMQDVAERFCIVFNGTIYNYPELRQQLIAEGYQFRSHSDTEVIINAYARWGGACTEKFHGMFAFAIWDRQKKTLFLARDRMGIKPLYYMQTGRGFYFASNPQALIATGDCDTAIDPVGLHHQLSLHAVIPAPRTLLKGVRKFRPGYQMLIDSDGKVNEQRYWLLKAHRPENALGGQEWNEQIQASLIEAVKRRIDIADVPVGVLLSGGLDSSLLVALLAEAGGWTDKDIQHWI